MSIGFALLLFFLIVLTSFSTLGEKGVDKFAPAFLSITCIVVLYLYLTHT